MATTMENLATNGAPVTAPPPSPNITAKTLCLHLHFGFLGNSRRLASSKIVEKDAEDLLQSQSDLEAAPVVIDADKEVIRVTKKLFVSKPLTNIQRADSQMKNQVREVALASPFRSGFYLIPYAKVEEVTDWLVEYGPKRAELVKKFLAVYEEEKKASMDRLRGCGSTFDYPTAASVENQFAFEFHWVSFETPTKLREIKKEIFKMEAEKAANDIKTVTEEIIQMKRAQLLNLTNHLIERLTPDETGKPKRLHASAVTNVSEFLDSFDVMNVADDKELAKIAGDMKKLLAGVDPKTLKKDQDLKDMMKADFEKIKTQLDLLVVEGNTRAISLED